MVLISLFHFSLYLGLNNSQGDIYHARRQLEDGRIEEVFIKEYQCHMQNAVYPEFIKRLMVSCCYCESGND